MELYDQIQEALKFIRTKTDFIPEIGIILGTGLGELANDIKIECEISYTDIPHFPASTVESHKGKLIFGMLSGRRVVCMAGRFHYYEGYSMKQVTFPVRVMKFLGIHHIFISNAAGGTNENYKAGDLVFIKDHINAQPENPLRGANDERLGLRFPDMLTTYDKATNSKALNLCKQHNIQAHEGVYYGLQGPNLETPAEYRMINLLGGDVVGMSTIPEVLVAKHSDLKITVASVISNQCFPIDTLTETTLEEVIKIVTEAGWKLRLVVKELLKAVSYTHLTLPTILLV